MTHVLILGSTGSIGRQALEVLPCIPGLHLAGLAAHANVDLVLEQAAQTGARVVLKMAMDRTTCELIEPPVGPPRIQACTLPVDSPRCAPPKGTTT